MTAIKRLLVLLILILITTFAAACGENGGETTSEHNVTEDQVMVHFRVTVPEETPDTDIVYLELDGSIPEAMKMALEKTQPSTWEGEVKVPDGAHLQYRYTRNNLGYMAAEAFEPDDKNTYREFSADEAEVTIADEVPAWRWLPKELPTADITIAEEFNEPKRGRDFIKGIAVFDYWWPEFEPLINSTIDKIISYDARWVQLPVIYGLTSTEPLEFGSVGVTIPESVLREFLRSAHEAGLKVALAIGRFEGIEEVMRRAGPGEGLKSVYEKEIDIYEKYARLAEEEGVELLILGMDNYPEEDFEIVDSGMNQLSETVKQNYSGFLTTDYFPDPPPEEKYSFTDKLDYIGDKWWPPLADTPDTDRAEMLKKARKELQGRYYSLFQKYGKPVLFSQIGFSSFDGAAMGIMSAEDPRISEWEPLDNSIPFDFQEQADAYNASLQAMAETPWIAGVYSFGFAYWDTIDKSPSVRGKPAGEVLKQWYQQIK